MNHKKQGEEQTNQEPEQTDEVDIQPLKVPDFKVTQKLVCPVCRLPNCTWASWRGYI